MNINDIIKKTYLHALTDGRYSETLSVGTAPFNATSLVTYHGTTPSSRQDYYSLKDFIFKPSQERPEMKILEELSWSNPKIIYKGTEYELALFGQENHLLKTLYAANDDKPVFSLPGNTDFWKKGEIDTGIQYIFGYEIDGSVSDSEKQIKPIDPSVIYDINFMPDADVDIDRPFPFGERVKAKDRVHYTVQPLRVIVMLELIILRPFPDFEPSGTAEAIRIFPQTMILSNDRLDKIHTTTKLLRPSESFMKNGLMAPKIKSSVYTDQNLSFPGWKGTNGHYWYNIFDYYKTKMEAFNEKGKKWTVVNPDLVNRRSSFIKKELQDDGGYQTKSMVKEPKQGAFDNIHIAPSMNVLHELIDDSPLGNLPEIDEVAMAPGCQHDCFHLHWRWGSELGSTNLFHGWDNNFQPYKVKGAPMVPHNQRIDIELIDQAEERSFGEGLAYHAIMTKDINPGQIQYVFHHGFGYVYGLNGPSSTILKYIIQYILENKTEQFKPYIKEEFHDNSWGIYYYFIQNDIVFDQETQKWYSRKRLDTNFEDAARQ